MIGSEYSEKEQRPRGGPPPLRLDVVVPYIRLLSQAAPAQVSPGFLPPSPVLSRLKLFASLWFNRLVNAEGPISAKSDWMKKGAKMRWLLLLLWLRRVLDGIFKVSDKFVLAIPLKPHSPRRTSTFLITVHARCLCLSLQGAKVPCCAVLTS